MARKERRLRAKLGLPMGLIERVETSEMHTSGAKAPARKVGSMYGLKPVPSVQPRSSKASGTNPGPTQRPASEARPRPTSQRGAR
jgi:hypothetical protein